MELFQNVPTENLLSLIIFWFGVGCILIFNLNVWGIADTLNIIEKSGYPKTAIFGSLISIMLWPGAVFVMIPIAQWVHEQEKKKLAAAEEELREIQERTQ